MGVPSNNVVNPMAEEEVGHLLLFLIGGRGIFDPPMHHYDELIQLLAMGTKQVSLYLEGIQQIDLGRIGDRQPIGTIGIVKYSHSELFFL